MFVQTFIVICHRGYSVVKLVCSIRVLPDCALAFHFLRLKVQARLYRLPKLSYTVFLVNPRAIGSKPIDDVFERRSFSWFGSERVKDESEVYRFGARRGLLLRGLMRCSPIEELSVSVGC